MEYQDILNIEDLKEREILLREYWNIRLLKKDYDTGLPSIISEEEFKDFVEVMVEHDLQYKLFTSDHPKYPNFPCARTLRSDYFDYSAKLHGFIDYNEFVKWKYEGPWKPSGQLFYLDYNYNDK